MKQFGGVLIKPLTLNIRAGDKQIDERDLREQLAVRIGALFAHYGVAPSLEQWDGSVIDLLLALSKDNAPFLLRTTFFNQSLTNLPAVCAWEMVAALAREHVPGFRFATPTKQAVTSGKELVILDAIATIQQLEREGGNQLSQQKIVEGFDNAKNDDILKSEKAKRIRAALLDSFPNLAWATVKKLRPRAGRDVQAVSMEQGDFIKNDYVDHLLRTLPNEQTLLPAPRRESPKENIINTYNSLVASHEAKPPNQPKVPLRELADLILRHHLENRHSSLPPGQEYELDTIDGEGQVTTETRIADGVGIGFPVPPEQFSENLEN